MKKIVLILIPLIFLLFQSVSAQQNFSDSQPRLSPMTKTLLNELNSIAYTTNDHIILPLEMKEKYMIRTGANGISINALLKVADNFNEDTLHYLNIHIGTKAGNIWTANIPITMLQSLIRINELEYIQIDEPVKTKLDNARVSTGVNLVHQGTSLQQSYYGSGVVVGVIDNGFDYTHPMFYDPLGTTYRVKRIWEQTKSGIPPSGYTYGNELVGETAILAAQSDTTSGVHGTHVTGIAAGSGSGTNGQYMGMAPQSDIVWVSLGGGILGAIDGIKYIFNYANSVGKPAVINLSLGSHIGPHDGTSLFDQACENLVGSGKILVGSAGNEGNVPLHIEYTFTSNDTLFGTFVDFEETSNKKGLVDSWGQQGKDFGMSLALYDPVNQTFSSGTGNWFAKDDTTLTRQLTGSDNNICTISFSTSSVEFNNSLPRIFLDITNNSDDLLALFGHGSNPGNGSVHLWNNSNNDRAGFSSKGLPWAIDGDTLFTVGEIGGTGKSMISVGAYTSKNSYTDFQGSSHTIPFFAAIEDIAPFSSTGPTVDGRTKPDIAAPGNVVISSVNSYDTNYNANDTTVVAKVNFNNRDYWFASEQGTSMAAPMVTGIVALWLEADPSLAPMHVKQYMYDNAKTDNFTGSAPNNFWGWGKIDAHESIKAVISHFSVNENSGISGDIEIYPNPASGKFALQSLNRGINSIEILDYSGRIVLTKKININDNTIIDVSNLSSGIYLLKFTDGRSFGTQKLIIR